MTGTNHTVAGLTDGVEYTKEHLKDTRLEMPFLDFGWYPKTRLLLPTRAIPEPEPRLLRRWP